MTISNQIAQHRKLEP